VVVIGAGITGALVADMLTREGLSVVILDRRAPACGSTAASTSLLTYEIDVSLKDLAGMMGWDDAVRAYALSVRAVGDLERIAASLNTPTGFRRTSSVCLAARRSHSRRLEAEAALRAREGIDAAYWSAKRVQQTYGFHSHGALYTDCTGVLDPVRFTRALLTRAMRGGAVLRERTAALNLETRGTGVRVSTERGKVEARWAVYAMGYEIPASLRRGIVALHTTYALVTEPVADLGPWGGDCIVWETGRPYFYMRATDDHRVMIGGADTPFKSDALRDQLMPGRTRKLEHRMATWLPAIETETAFVWAGTFGETEDGLPYIGPAPGCPQILYALGYGANGITFGAIAARILADLCLGRGNEDTRLFRLDRKH
jgi:glycine/D-amino acid oxidase-like deaminating enzyme